MKQVSFLVAILAFLQIASGSPAIAQQRQSDDDPHQQIELSAEKIGEQLEHWAQDNSQELEAWKKKYAEQWESWGQRFAKKMEQLAADEEDVWGHWARKYEQDLDRWTQELESSELAPRQIGQFVQKNLKTLSRIPLGQMVDQALEESLGELSEAPWESLGELGEIAKQAFEEPINELSKILDKKSNKQQAIERNAGGIGESLEQFDKAVDRENSAKKENPEAGDRADPRIKALKKLREREDMTRQQRARIDELIQTIQDASHLKTDLKGEADASDRAGDRESRIDVPRTDQIKEKIQREKNRQSQRDSIRSGKSIQREAQQTSDQESKKLSARLPKRVDGKNLDRAQKKPTNPQKGASQRFQRDGRDGKANRKPAVETIRIPSAKSNANVNSEIEVLRAEIAKLRREMQSLNKRQDK